jgi:hypothetical protein
MQSYIITCLNISIYIYIYWFKSYAAQNAMFMFFLALPGLVGALVLEMFFIIRSTYLLVAFLVIWGFGAWYFLSYGINIIIQSVFNTKYLAFELVPLALTYGEANKLFDTYIEMNGNDFNMILTYSDWVHFLEATLYDAISDKHMVQKKLSLYADRVATAVFDDRIEEQMAKEKEKSTRVTPPTNL